MSPVAGQSGRAEQLERALAHVRAEQYDEALVVFRALAGESPHDYEARNWVARLESWKGNLAEAERLYRAVLDEQPGNREAELGLADVIAWQGRYRGALVRLNALYERDPADPEVLLRLARVLRWSGDRQAALRHYRELLARAPDNEEAQDGIRLLTEQTRYRLEAGYFFEEFDFASSTHGQFVELLYDGWPRTALLGRFGFQRKFQENVARFSLGLSRRLGERAAVRGEASFAPGAAVLASQDYEIEAARELGPWLSAGLGYRFLDFRAAQVHVLAPHAELSLRPSLRLFARYTPARTRFPAPAPVVWNHSGWARLTWDATPTWSPYLLFGVGSENFAGVSSEQLGRFAAQTYGCGATVQLNRRQGLRAGYYYQNRTQGRHEHNLAVAFFLRF